MEVDKTTINDLSIFERDDEFSIFSQLDRTITTNGRERLRYMFNHPLKTRQEILDTGMVIQHMASKIDQWPKIISNGSVMVVEKMYESHIDPIPPQPGIIGYYAYKLLHGPDFSLLKYSVGHAFQFLKGMSLIVEVLDDEKCPYLLKKLLSGIKQKLNSDYLSVVNQRKNTLSLSGLDILKLGHTFIYRFKHNMFGLLQDYAQLDAWYSMAKVTIEKKFCFPEFTDTNDPYIDAEGLYHPLISNAVPYDIQITREKNFLFLTGANMAGKSTFIKSVGVAVFLAHTGMGVPAKKLKLSFFDGLLSNINVIDNIAKGESYFFNEVQRIRNTIIKINDNRKWLILIDELFKGTNVHDAMKCSVAVIEGLLKIKNSLFILSTHLYEISQDLKHHPNIFFRYFETGIQNEELFFNYQLRDGVSDDRMGYLILKQEGVIDLIKKL